MRQLSQAVVHGKGPQSPNRFVLVTASSEGSFQLTSAENSTYLHLTFSADERLCQLHGDSIYRDKGKGLQAIVG